MVDVHAQKLEIRYFGQGTRNLNLEVEHIFDFGDKLGQEIEQKHPEVGAYARNSIAEKLFQFCIRSTEVK